MNLKDLASQILNEGFNAKTDSVSDFEDLQDGIYDVVLMGAQWRANEKGTEWISFEFELLNEGFENRKYFGNIFFSNEKMMQLNLKRTMKYAAVLDVELTVEDFEDTTDLVEAIKAGVGNQATLTLKSNKTGTFQNWELTEMTPF
jgi:Protein of unknown function (DUF669)